jgi:hypothetical protein
VKQRKRFELIPHIKYCLIFDERVDKAELTKLIGPQLPLDLLMDEIAEEEKNFEIVVKQDEKE